MYHDSLQGRFSTKSSISQLSCALYAETKTRNRDITRIFQTRVLIISFVSQLGSLIWHLAKEPMSNSFLEKARAGNSFRTAKKNTICE